MLECYHITISSNSSLCSDTFVPSISLPLFVCSLSMAIYLLVNKLLCHMNGIDWISDKGLVMSRDDAGSLFYKVLPRQFVPQHVQPQEHSLSEFLRCCCCTMPGLVARWDTVWRWRQFKRHIIALPWCTAEGVVDGGVRSGTDSCGATSQPGFAAELEAWTSMPWIQELRGFRSPTFRGRPPLFPWRRSCSV